MSYQIRVRREFSAAHYLSGAHGKCEEMHGHNYVVEVAIASPALKGPGMVEDFVKVKQDLEQVLPDHRVLNEVFAFNPTAENLARYFCEQLSAKYAVARVTVWENDACCAEYSPD
jgi:6-pyruvoyltetrahydropterin/6-carboxytetrahydropterin synthase